MFGLFLENGPLRVSRTGGGADDFELKAAQNSWADTYNMIFLDQPVGTGFSYGDSFLTSMQDGSDEFLTFLNEFYNIYPELKENKFYLTGESYAGKYLPLFTHDILESNKNATFKIPLVSTMIIDPYPSPVLQRTDMHEVPFALGIIDQNNLNQIASLEQICYHDYTYNISKG